MKTIEIIELLTKLQEEIVYSMNVAIELKALSEKDPEFVEKLNAFINHCKEERKR